MLHLLNKCRSKVYWLFALLCPKIYAHKFSAFNLEPRKALCPQKKVGLFEIMWNQKGRIVLWLPLVHFFSLICMPPKLFLMLNIISCWCGGRKTILDERLLGSFWLTSHRVSWTQKGMVCCCTSPLHSKPLCKNVATWSYKIGLRKDKVSLKFNSILQICVPFLP